MKYLKFETEKDLQKLKKVTSRIEYLQDRINKMNKEINEIKENNKIGDYSLSKYDDATIIEIDRMIKILR